MATCPSHSLSLSVHVLPRRRTGANWSPSTLNLTSSRSSGMRGAVGGVRHSSIPVPAVGLGACIPKTEVGAQGAKTHRHSISAAAAYQGGIKGRLPLTSIKIKSKVFRFKHLLHTWAQRFRWSKQLSEQPKSSLLISGRLFRHYELQGRETGSVASLSCARIDPRSGPPQHKPPRRPELCAGM